MNATQRTAQHGCHARVLLALFALLPTLAPAVTVHTWVDDDGVRHYADAPPGEPATASTPIELSGHDAAAAAGDDYYSIVNQWSRLREERDAADALALECERLRRTSPPPTAQPAASVPRQVYAPGYGYGVPYAYGSHAYGRGAYGAGYPSRRGGVAPAQDRGAYLAGKRRRGGFLPLPAPSWSR